MDKVFEIFAVFITLYSNTFRGGDVFLFKYDKKSLFFGGVNAVSRKNAVGDDRRGGVGMIIEK